MNASVVLSSVFIAVFLVHHYVRTTILYVISILLPFIRVPVQKVSKQTAVLITGTSTGIGRAAAASLAKKGYTVFAGVRKQSDLNQWLSVPKASVKGEIIPLNLDVRDEQSVEKALQSVKLWLSGDKTRKLAAIVNNAGVSNAIPFELQSTESFEHILDVNLLGVVRVTKAFLPLLREHQGRIVNIGSINGFLSVPLMSSYCASKHALEGLTDSLRFELSSSNIFVSLVEPGSIQTPMFEKAELESKHRKSSSVYSELLDTSVKTIHALQERGSSSQCVSMVISHAIESKFPQTR
jgi:NAD(P)-dependent dehydrogenase (short-subunit alcohol dehydrogenase family)